MSEFFEKCVLSKEDIETKSRKLSTSGKMNDLCLSLTCGHTVVCQHWMTRGPLGFHFGDQKPTSDKTPFRAICLGKLLKYQLPVRPCLSFGQEHCLRVSGNRTRKGVLVMKSYRMEYWPRHSASLSMKQWLSTSTHCRDNHQELLVTTKAGLQSKDLPP